MPGRDDEKLDDLAADFFGEEDLDWLDESAPRAKPKKPPGPPSAAPSAPPPPPPFDGPTTGASVVPRDQAEVSWPQRRGQTPTGEPNLSSQKTLIFSDIPTIPPLDDEPGQVVAPAVVSEDDTPTTSVNRELRLAALDALDANDAALSDFEESLPGVQPTPTMVPSDYADLDEDDADTHEAEAVFADSPEEVPLVRTQDPAPVRLAMPSQAIGSPQYTPVFDAGGSLPVVAPDPEGSWDDLARALTTEAAVANPEERGEYLFRAGWVTLHQRGLPDQAEALYNEAFEVGCRTPLLYRERADIALRVQDWSRAAKRMEQVGNVLVEAAAAEAYRESAALHLKKLDDLGSAVRVLRKGLAEDPNDYGTLLMLSEHLPVGDPERVRVLKQMASLCSGLLAAERTYEAALQLPDDNEEGTALLRHALELDARHAPAFILLEQRLIAAGDHQALAQLYAGEINHAGSEAQGWWQLLSARHRILAGDDAGAAPLLLAAQEAGWAFAGIVPIICLTIRGDVPAAAKALWTEASKHTGVRAACMYYRLGWAYETRLNQPNEAVASYQACLAADPSALPAEEGILRCLDLDPDKGRLVERLLQSVEQGQKAFVLRLAEAAETSADWARAKTAYAMLATESGPSFDVARAGLVRVLRAQQDWPALSEALEARAGGLQPADLRGGLLHAAAQAGATHPPEHTARATRLLQQALDEVPNDLASLASIEPLLRAEGSWGALASIHQRAGDQTEDVKLKTSLLYEAARLHDRAGNPHAATACLRSSLDADAGFLPAKELLLQLSAKTGDSEPLRAHHLALGECASGPDAAAIWHRFAAAVIAGIDSSAGIADLRAILNVHHEHPGAQDALETGCEVAHDLAALEGLLRERIAGPPSIESARETLRLAELLLRDGRPEPAAALLTDLASMSVEKRPLQPAVRLARRAHAVDAAMQLLHSIPQRWARVERAALLARRRHNLADAESELRTLVADGEDEAPAHLAAALGAAVDQPALVELGQRALADRASSAPVRFMNTLLAAQQQEHEGNATGALALYQRALGVQPASIVASLGALRCALAGDPDALAALADLPTLDPIVMGVLLEQNGLISAARATLTRAADADVKLPAVLHVQRLLQAQQDWSGAYDAVMLRFSLSRDEAQREEIESTQRWMLANKLADTDAAWELYQDLHTQSPDDRSITEALAHIAGVRGETDRAIEFLDELAGQCSDPDDAARYKRRVAHAHEAAGNPALARGAFLDALDFVPNDAESLAGLKRLSEADEDWPALIQVLQREAGLVDDGSRIEVLRQIARTTEERLEDPALAVDAWHTVLEEQASDEEALTRTLALAEAQQDWNLFIETGNVLAALSRGASRTTLLRRLGVVSTDHLNREDAVRYFERAIQEDPPDLEAARRLEAIYRRRSDAQAVARTLEIQGRVGTDDAEKVAALLRAAQHELSTRHDREAASVFYKRALVVQPDNEESLRFMASHLFESGRFDEALPICEKLAPMVENDQDLDDFDTRMELAQFYYYYAEMLRLGGEEIRSIEQYEKALALNPTYVAALEAVGPLYKQTERWNKALGVFRQLLQLSGGQGERHKVASTYTNLGLVERALGNTEKAKKRFNKALEIDPNHVEALKGMALLLEDREDWSNLLNIYNNIIYHATVADDVIDAYMTKGRVLDDHMSRPDKAAQHYQRSLDFKADQPVALLRLAELAMRRDAYQEAGDLAAQGSKLCKYEPPLVTALLLMCEAAAKQDASHADEAVSLMAKAATTQGMKTVPDGLLADLEALRQYIKDQLPR